MTKRVKVMLAILTVLISCLIVLVVYDGSEPVNQIDNSQTVAEVNNTSLDDRMSDYLATTETTQTSTEDKDAGYKIGVLEIASCNFKEDVMYSENLMYYTEHNSKNAKSSKGAIFMDARITDYNSKILVIHGLTTKDADMFSLLASYTDATWYGDNKEIKLKLDGCEEKTYQLFSVVETTSSDAVIYLNCETDLAYKSFYESLVKQSCVELESEFNADRQMVILNTAIDDGTHYIVCFMEK